MASQQETIRKVVQEGLEARNLLNFISDGCVEESMTSKKPPLSPRPQSVSPKPGTLDCSKVSDTRSLLKMNKRRAILSRPKSRLRSASAGRNPEKDLRARYWTFLFENLHRAVDEIYQTCEMDESIVESKEAIMMLENYSRDFHALIQYININKNYEKTAPLNRPTSLTWEVRKSSPGKSLLKNVFIEKLTAGTSNAKRVLCFDSASEITLTSGVQKVPISSGSNQQENKDCIETSNTGAKAEIGISNTISENIADVAISVPIPSEETFPCKEQLVVNQVTCQSNNDFPDQPSAKESLANEVIKETTAITDNKSEIVTAESIPDNKTSDEDNSSLGISSCTSSFKSDSISQEFPSSELQFGSGINSDFIQASESLKKTSPEICSSIAAKPSTVTEKEIHLKTKISTNKDIKKPTTPVALKSAVSEGKTKLSKVDGTSSTRVSKTQGLKDAKESSNAMVVRNVPLSKSSNSTNSAKRIIDQNLQKPATATVVNKLVPSKSITDRKNSATFSDGRRVSRTNNTESAIKRNISYVQSLSSKNHSEKADSSVKKISSQTPVSRHKLSQKSGSMSSLHKETSTRNWARKTASVEKIPEVLKSNTDEDSDGWETVRGRNRCRNSPAKIPFMSKQLQNSQAAQIAKLNQSRIGGFPYTTKVNGKVVPKHPQKPFETTKKHSAKTAKDVTSKVATPPASNKNNVVESASNSLETSGSSNDSGDVFHLKQDNSSKRSSRRECLSLPLNVISVIEKGSNDFDTVKHNFCSVRSSSAPNVRSCHERSVHCLSKVLCISDQSLGTQKYININLFKKKLSEKTGSSTKRRQKKSRIADDMVDRTSTSTNLDESDNAVTSDDQDGQMSHDEAFDVQCQELYDTAWKYKILEQQVHKLELSWGEQMDLFDMELRTPGRALEMHEKLSSPFRKKSLYESIRVCNEKQVKAQEQRERLLEEKAQKFKIIQKKRLEMKSLIEQRQEKQRVLMEQKLQRAEEKRKKQLQMIIRKAHDEKEKVNEIAFINSLEAQNKRHDLISKEKDHEARLHDIQEERQRRQEEKAAKEAAAEGRRKILEAERQARLYEMQEKRKIKDHKVEQLFLVKEKERQELANQKARDRELRLSALNAQQQISIEELQKKIQLKQEESARRHEENMEQIRQKAFELSIRRCSSNSDDVPQPVPYDTKKICTICNVLIGSEVYLLSHLQGKKHQEAVKAQYQDKDPSTEELELYNLKHIVDASTDQLDPNIALDKERQKALKKRCKKLRQRMYNRGQEYESQSTKEAESLNSNLKLKMEKISNDIKKISTLVEEKTNHSNMLPALERATNEVFTLFQKKLNQNKIEFKSIGGIAALVNIFNIVSHLQVENTFAYKKILNHLGNVMDAVIDNSQDACNFMLFSNKIGNLLDFLIHRLHNLIPDNISQLMVNQTKLNGITVPLDMTAGKLLHLLTSILSTLCAPSSLDADKRCAIKIDDFHSRIQDVISYIVSIGIVDKLSQFFHCIQGPISNEEEVSTFLSDCVAFLTALIKLNSDSLNFASNGKTEDSTQLIATLRVTNLAGSISLLYGLLLHSGVSSRSEAPPTALPKQIECLAFSTLCMLNHTAVMSLQAFQGILGSEGLSLQLRHITGHLLWYCGHVSSDALLHEVILLLGYFTVLNSENQTIIQAGQRPTVLQQLCCLPFLYFSDLELTDILFPSLIACCYNNTENKTILQQEMTSELLSNFIEVKYLNIEEGNSKDRKNSAYNKRWLFAVRFPKCHWSSAKHYFSSA